MVTLPNLLKKKTNILKSFRLKMAAIIAQISLAARERKVRNVIWNNYLEYLRIAIAGYFAYWRLAIDVYFSFLCDRGEPWKSHQWTLIGASTSFLREWLAIFTEYGWIQGLWAEGVSKLLQSLWYLKSWYNLEDLRIWFSTGSTPILTRPRTTPTWKEERLWRRRLKLTICLRGRGSTP